MDNDLKRSLIKLMVTIVERGKGEKAHGTGILEHGASLPKRHTAKANIYII